MSKLARNLSFATMTAAAVFTQSVLATSQNTGNDAVTIADVDGEIYQNAINISLLNDSLVDQAGVISNIATGVGQNDVRITGNDNDISALTQSVNDIAITAATAWQWTRDNDGFVYQNQSRGLANQRRIAEQDGVINTQNAVIDGNTTLIIANKEISDTQYKKVWDLAIYNNNYVVDAWMMTLDNEERLKETQSTLADTNVAVDANTALLGTTTATANSAKYTSDLNYGNISRLYDWGYEITTEHNAMNAYIGVMPEDHESDLPATLYKHAAQENIHLGSGAQVGDNLNEGDEGYDPDMIKTGMTAVGSNSRADADTSTALGARSKTYGENSVAVGYQSIANDANTVSFGNDYQAEVVAVEAVEYKPEVEAVKEVIVDGEVWVSAVEYQPEVQAVEAVEGKAEILENNRRLTHVADGIDKNDVVNVKQLNTTAQYLDDRQRATEERLLAGQVTWNDKLETLSDKAMHGIAISMATKVFLPDPGKKFRVNVGVAEYEGASALGISGSGRINNDTALYFGLGTDTAGEHTAVQAGASYQW